jgi:hypothetical protein
MTTLEKVKSSIKQFEQIQNKHRSYGAMDTEPDGIFQGILVRAVKGDNCRIPSEANFWELYSDMEGVSAASSEMSFAAKDAVEVIHNCPVRDLKEVKTYLKDYCWRYY